MGSESRWLITGSDGILGQEMQFLLERKDVQYLAANKNKLDVTNLNDIEEIFSRFNPTHVVNCAALTDVDACEVSTNKAREINYMGVVNLVKFCKVEKTRFFQVSTNFVFGGNENQIYSKSDIADPVNVYGSTKFEAENYCLGDKELDITIVRTASTYSGYGNNFVLRLLSNLLNNKPTKVIQDIYVQPTWAFNVAELIYDLSNYSNQIPTLHAVSAGKTTWWEFAEYLCELAELDSNLLTRIDLNDLNLRAKRPRHAILSNDSFDNALELNDWKSMLQTSLPILLRSGALLKC